MSTYLEAWSSCQGTSQLHHSTTHLVTDTGFATVASGRGSGPMVPASCCTGCVVPSSCCTGSVMPSGTSGTGGCTVVMVTMRCFFLGGGGCRAASDGVCRVLGACLGRTVVAISQARHQGWLGSGGSSCGTRHFGSFLEECLGLICVGSGVVE